MMKALCYGELLQDKKCESIDLKKLKCLPFLDMQVSVAPTHVRL